MKFVYSFPEYLERNCFVRSCDGCSITCLASPCSTITPLSMKIT